MDKMVTVVLFSSQNLECLRNNKILFLLSYVKKKDESLTSEIIKKVWQIFCWTKVLILNNLLLLHFVLIISTNFIKNFYHSFNNGETIETLKLRSNNIQQCFKFPIITLIMSIIYCGYLYTSRAKIVEIKNTIL